MSLRKKAETRIFGVVSDAHGNGPAFDLGIQILRSVGADRFVFLGDAVGYIPSTSVVSSLQELGGAVTCLKGNHESMLLEDEGTASESPVYRLSLTRQLLSASQKRFIQGWKEFHTEMVDGRDLLFLHGSPGDPTGGYVYPDSDLSAIDTDADLVFMGNTHRPFLRPYNDKVFVNVGSCGLPRDDGRFASVASVELPSMEIRILRYRVDSLTKEFVKSLDVDASIVQSIGRRTDRLIGDLV